MPSAAKSCSSFTLDPERYVRLPQVVLDRRKPRHAQLLDAMQAQGFYTPAEDKKFLGYAELVRDFLFGYFGLTAENLASGVGGPASVPAHATLHDPVSGLGAPQSDHSDDLAASYFSYDRSEK